MASGVSSMFCKGESAKNNFCCAVILDHFQAKQFQTWDHFFPLLIPKDSKSLISLQSVLQEVGAKRCFNGTSKSERRDGQIHGQTNTGTNKSTYRLNQLRGLIQWKAFKNYFKQLKTAKNSKKILTNHFKKNITNYFFGDKKVTKLVSSCPS